MSNFKKLKIETSADNTSDNLINKKEVYDYPPEVLYYDLIDKTW
jgi:hypothetical protein